TSTGPATGRLSIAVRLSRPAHSAFRSRPALTEITRAIATPGTVSAQPAVRRTRFPGCAAAPGDAARRPVYPEGHHHSGEAAMTVGPGYGAAGVGRAQMRAATADRDRAVEVITRAYTDGRLSKDEHDTRVERAMTASTFAELDSVVIDLPGGGP